MAYERISDDEFTKEAKAMNAAAQGNSSGGNSKWLEEFKKIKYVPISTKCTVVRCLGRLPKHFGSTKSETDAMIVCRAPMMTDKGFTFDVTFPDPADNPNHILNKIAKKVMEFDWIKQADGSSKIVYVHQLSHPESFKWVRYGGVPDIYISNSALFKDYDLATNTRLTYSNINEKLKKFANNSNNLSLTDSYSSSKEIILQYINDNINKEDYTTKCK